MNQLKEMLKQNATKSHKKKPGTDVLDRAIALNLIQRPGLTDEEIARELGVSRETVNRRKNMQSVTAIINHSLALPTKEIRRLMAKAFTKLEHHLDDPDPRVSLVAATQLLKFGGAFHKESGEEATLLGEIKTELLDVSEEEANNLKEKILSKLEDQIRAREPVFLRNLNEN